MKITTAILLLLGLVSKSFCQDIASLEKKLNTNLSPKERVETLNLISREHTFVNAVKALEYAKEAFKLSSEIGDLMGKANAYRNMGSIYSYNESYFNGIDYLQKAMDIFSSKNDSVGIANCYISLGHTYRRLQNRQKEVEYHLKAFKIFSRLKIKERIGVTSHNLSEAYYNAKDFQKSREMMLYSIEINNSLNNQLVLSSCYKVMGLLELADNNMETAEKYFLKTIEISEKLGKRSQKTATIESMIQLAAINKKKKNDTLQFKLLQKAADSSKAYKLSKYLQIAYEELILYSLTQKDLKAAQENLLAYRLISDSLNEKQLHDKDSLMQSVIQGYQLSKEKTELENYGLELSQKIIARNIVLIVIAFLAVVLLWLLFKLSGKNKLLKVQNQIIEKQKRDLEILNQTKDKFFSIVAHDLKSPLNSLKGFSNLLINYMDDLSKEQIMEMSKELDASVNNTIKMADNLIAWAKVQMNEQQIQIEKISLEEIVNETCEVYKNIAQAKKIQISNQIEGSWVIYGDKNQIEFVIRNLVNNAIKFTHQKGLVSLKANLLATSEVEIEITDTGIGISDEIKENLFSLKQKKSLNGTANEKGTGLGLVLSHDFVKQNGGSIGCQSELGRGTTFYVKLKGEKIT